MIHHSAYNAATWGGALTEAADPGSDGTGSEHLLCRDIPSLILFHTCCIVLFTVVINGSTVAPLLARLGMDTLSDERKFMLQCAPPAPSLIRQAALPQWVRDPLPH